MKSPIKIYLRIKPTNRLSDAFVVDEDKSEIQVKTNTQQGILNQHSMSLNFFFNKIYFNDTQEQLYDECVRSLVTNSINGISSSIMTYG